MDRQARLLAACAAIVAVIATGLAMAPQAAAHGFHRFGYGFGLSYPVFYAPPPVYVAPPPVAYIPPPPPISYGYGYRYGYRYRRVVHHYYHRVAHRRWCSCYCCR